MSQATITQATINANRRPTFRPRLTAEFYFEFITTYNISEHTFSSGDHTDIASQLSHVRSRSLIKRKSYGTNMILIMPTSMRAQRTWKEMH
ncbi:hypothetical protein YC2023_101093 [Brassica napus]